MIRYVKIAGKRISVSVVVYLAYIIFYISGYNGAGHNYIQTLLFVFWNAVAFWEDRESYQKALFCLPNLFLYAFILFYFFSSTIVGGFMYTLEYTARYLMLYGCLTQFLYYRNRNNYNEVRLLAGAGLLTFAFFAVKAILFFLQNPSAARILAANYYAFENTSIGGGYRLAFGAAILSVGFFEMLINGRVKVSLFRKVLCYLIVLLFVFLLIKTESTITLISALFGMAVAVVNKIAYGQTLDRRGNPRRKILGTTLIVCLLLLAILNVNNIGKWMMDLTEDSMEEVLGRRFYRIGEKLYYFGSENAVSNYVDTRLKTAIDSWRVFLKYPIFGVGYKCGNVFRSLAAYGVGTHSTFFDMLAQHGIVGASMFFAFIGTALRKIHRDTRCSCYVIALFIMMTLNPFNCFQGYFSLLTLLPLLGSLFDKGTYREWEGPV